MFSYCVFINRNEILIPWHRESTQLLPEKSWQAYRLQTTNMLVICWKWCPSFMMTICKHLKSVDHKMLQSTSRPESRSPGSRRPSACQSIRTCWTLGMMDWPCRCRSLGSVCQFSVQKRVYQRVIDNPAVLNINSEKIAIFIVKIVCTIQPYYAVW